ncbi:noggin-like [Pleurodeles waltl]
MWRPVVLVLCALLWSPYHLTGVPVPPGTLPGAMAPPETEDLDIRRRPSSGHRPYSLSLSPDDYHYSPKPRHLRAARLLRLLGPSFDPFWMSVEDPRNGSTSGLGTPSRDLADGAARYRRKLLREAEALAGPALPPGEASANLTRAFRAWLVEQASCRLTSTWVDLGPVFWPRWVRHTDCDEKAPSSCSWPPGMACRRAQLTHIKLLAWHCWATPVEVVAATGRTAQQCTWRLVPYPVVAACKCACGRGQGMGSWAGNP